MPKAFDTKEKVAIRAALMQKGLEHFERYGVRKARIDDICREIGIAKGSFYAFFPSKEELFMAIVEDRETAHMADIVAFIDTAPGDDRARAGGFFDLIRDKIERDPVLNLVLAHGEIAHLVRKLGPQRFEAGQERDRRFAVSAAEHWQAASGRRIDAADLLSLMTITLSVATQRAQMTPDQYRPAIALLRDMFVDRLVGAAA